MIEIGKYNELEILRETTIGLYLGDEEGDDVLLPNNYCPESYEIGDKIWVFVYLDNQARKIATNMTPKILLHEFAFLEVVAVNDAGAFLEWGIVKDLLVPFKEQRMRMEVGRWYIVYMDIDEKSGRLFASNKIEHRLVNEDLTVKEGDKVELLVLQKTDLGFSVIINNKYKGLIFENEIFEEIRVGQKQIGYVKNIRADNKIDITLQPQGYLHAKDPHMDLVERALHNNNGFLPLHDKSTPDDIYAMLKMSKKAFKRSIGNLYKAKKIEITSEGIRLIES